MIATEAMGALARYPAMQASARLLMELHGRIVSRSRGVAWVAARPKGATAMAMKESENVRGVEGSA